MRKFVKHICAIVALLMCVSLFGCVRKGCLEADTLYGKIISSDDLERLAYDIPEGLVNGHIIEGFGSYNGIALTWTVVNVDSNGVATLVCNDVIDALPFNLVREIDRVRGNETEDLFDELYVMNWENCSLRDWLNNEFLNEAFTEEEQSKLYYGELVTEKNPLTDKGECTTLDHVFVLSAQEAQDYFDNDEERLAYATDFAENNGVRIGAVSQAAAYWLRSSGESMWHACAVNTDGTISYSGMTVENTRIGIRPCIRLISNVPSGEIAVALESAEIGNIVSYGRYEQDNKNTTTDEEILWRVIDKKESKLLLMSVDILDAHDYNSELSGEKWATCGLRSWLNNDFYNIAFSDAEKGGIVLTETITKDNLTYMIDSGENSYDNVFVLSMEEVYTLLGENKEWRMAYACKYSKNRDDIGTEYDHGVTVDPNYGTSGWWLRNAGENDIKAMYVYYYGEVNKLGSLVRNTFIGVRPCIWIDTEITE